MSDMQRNDSRESEFDEALTKAMRRVNAPETLATFLARAAEVESESALPRQERSHRWAWFVPRQQRAAFGWLRFQIGAALAAVLLACVFVAQQVHVRHEREQAAVQQQFEQGLRITDRALDQTREKLKRAGLTSGN